MIEWLGPLLGFISLVGGALLTTAGMFYWEPEAHTAFQLGLRYGLPLWALLAPLCFLLARGRPTALLTFLLTMVPMLVGLPALIAGSALVINAKLDRGPIELRAVTVLRREQASEKDGPRYFLRIGNWRTGQSEPERLSITAAQYATAREGQQVQLRLRPGRLGWRWLEGWELDPR